MAEAVDGAAAAELLAGLQALNASVATGFDAFKAATAQLSAAVDRLEGALDAPLSAEAQEVALAALIRAGARGDYRDYVLAEQAAMALDVLLLSTARWEASRPAMDRVFESVDDEDRFDAGAFAQAVAALSPSDRSTRILPVSMLSSTAKFFSNMDTTESSDLRLLRSPMM